MRIGLQLWFMAEHGAVAVGVLQENARQAARQLGRDLLDGEVLARSGRAFHLEIVAVVMVELLQGFDDEEIDGEPDGPAPVGIAAELAAVGFRRLVAHGQIGAVDAQYIGTFEVCARHRSHAVGRQELGLIEHAGQQFLHAVAAQQRQQAALAAAGGLPIRHESCEVGPVREQPLQAFVEPG